MKILFLSRWFPYPIDNGAKIRIFNLLRGLAQVHEVHLISFADHPGSAAVQELESFCRSVQVAAWKEFEASSRRALLGLFSMAPRSLTDIYSTEMEQKIRQTLASQRFDLVITSQWQMTAYRHLFADLPVLYEEIEVGVQYGNYANAAGTAARLRCGLTWIKFRHYLRELLSRGQACTVASEEERQLLAAIVPNNPSIYVIPNGVNLKDYENVHPEPEPDHLIFTGSFRYAPNYSAMVWFLEHVYPRIQEEIPHVRLTITGDAAGLSLPQHKGVVQTGFVSSVHPYIARAWASIVPLHVGGGTRLKILEAMALCTPVISTSKGAEGLGAEKDKHLLICDSPEDFARQTIQLLKDPAMRKRIAANAFALMVNTYDWQVIMPRFLDSVAQAAARRNSGQPHIDKR